MERTVRRVRAICLAVAIIAFGSVNGFAQTSLITTYAGLGPFMDGSLATSQLIGQPSAVALDSTGSFYVASILQNQIYRVTTDGTIRLVAGNGLSGFSGDGGPATAAQIAGPYGLALDSAGNLYIADTGNNRIRKVNSGGLISTVAGSGTAGFGGDGGSATAAQLSAPAGVAVDAAGNIFIADTGNNRVRKVNSGGVITTVAGSGTAGFGGDGGPAAAALLSGPAGLALDAAGNLYIADTANNRVRKMTPVGVISTLAGSGAPGFGSINDGDGGLATAASINNPTGMALDAAGNLYIADQLNHLVRKVTPAGVISTAAGEYIPRSLSIVPVDILGRILGVAVDAAGNLYIAATDDNKVRTVTPSGVYTTVAGNDPEGFSGDGGSATAAQLSGPSGVVADVAGNLYIADTANNRIRKVTPGGIISTVAGSGKAGFGGDGGPATAAQIGLPFGLAVDAAGNLYIADTTNSRVRKVTPDGIIHTAAGGIEGYGGDGGPATAARLDEPFSITVDTAGNLFIADYYNYRIRKVTPDGVINTVAGNGTQGYSGDGGPATAAQIARPRGVAVDSVGNFYIADYDNYRIRKVTPSGVITTVAGNGTAGYSGDGGPATAAQISTPDGITVDAAGNLYISDQLNSRVRKVTPAGVISTLVGNGTRGYSGDGGPAASAQLEGPGGVALDTAGNLYIADHDNNRVRKVSFAAPSLVSISPASGSPGSSVTVTLTGSNFTIGVTTLDSIAGVTISNINATSSTSLTATFTINASAAAGPRSVTVTGGTGAAVTFTVNAPVVVPTFTGISPASAVWGSQITTTLTGTGFTSDMTINAGTGILVGNVNVLSSTSATATFTIVPGAATGAVNVSVTTTGGKSNSVVFVINSAPPVVSGISPNFGRRGASVAVVLSGTNLVSPLTISGGPDIALGAVTFNPDTTVTATLIIAPGAAIGVHNLVVTTSAGSTNTTIAVYPPAEQDFNADGKSDLLWYNAATGETHTWIMNGLVGSGAALLRDPNWKVIGTPDLNGDGKADLLWYNAATGQTHMWLMNGPSITGAFELLHDLNWKVIATADFDGDGKSDLLWYNAASGQTGMWLMNGPAITGAFELLRDLNWKVIGTPDLNGDGKSDLLWYNAATGQTHMWLMNGAAITGAFELLRELNWKVIGTPDLNGDGKSDLLWYNAATGQTHMWLMNGPTITGAFELLRDLNWKVTATAELNGDVKTDLIWYNAATGQTAAWLMNGNQVLSNANLLTDPNWKVLATATRLLIVTGSSLPDGAVGAAYSQTLKTNGPVADYPNWKLTAGEFPSGLSINPGTGKLEGTPTGQSGIFHFTISVEDTLGTTTSVDFQMAITGR